LSWNGIEGIQSYQILLSQDSAFVTGVETSVSNSEYQLTTNLISGTWFWKVNGVLNGQAYFSNLGKFQVFEPKDISNLRTWLRSDSAQVVNGKVVQLFDLSGNNNHSIQSNSNFQADFVVNNPNIQKPSLLFDGVNDFFSCPVNSTMGSSFVFSNWSGIESSFPSYNGILTTTDSYIFIGAISSNLLLSGGAISSNFRINSISTNNYSPFNQFKITSGNLSNIINTSSLLIGTDRGIGGRNWKGNITEIIGYGTSLSSQQLLKVENYLRDRYAPPVNLGADITPIYQNNGS
jgi:hypothetical protein